jgi:hypothetical protein
VWRRLRHPTDALEPGAVEALHTEHAAADRRWLRVGSDRRTTRLVPVTAAPATEEATVFPDDA